MAAATMALLMFGLAVLVGTAQERLLATLKERTQQIKQGSGAILFAVGAWLIVLAIWADLFTRIFPV